MVIAIKIIKILPIFVVINKNSCQNDFKTILYQSN